MNDIQIAKKGSVMTSRMVFRKYQPKFELPIIFRCREVRRKVAKS